MKIWSLPKHENLTTCKKYCRKEEKLLLRSNFSSFHNIFNISPNFKSSITHIFVKCGCSIFFSSILQFRYVEVRKSRSISESPLKFEITRVDCILDYKNTLSGVMHLNFRLLCTARKVLFAVESDIHYWIVFILMITPLNHNNLDTKTYILNWRRQRFSLRAHIICVKHTIPSKILDCSKWSCTTPVN